MGYGTGTGNTTIELTEIHPTGDTAPSGGDHQIYMATDEHSHPGSVLRLQCCYMHDAIGNANVLPPVRTVAASPTAMHTVTGTGLVDLSRGPLLRAGSPGFPRVLSFPAPHGGASGSLDRAMSTALVLPSGPR